jgi:multiple sugar transport system ATP-binding protein
LASVGLFKVSKIFDKNITAVDSVDITINDKEFIVLVGPSGCGKSTILRMIAGLEDITSGEIKIDSKVVNEIPPKDRDIAMVFQNYALYPHMSVYQNLAFGLQLRKYSNTEIETRVKDAAVILDIEHLLQRKPKALSGGQRQRVAVGRAIVRKPKVFLFDEPLSNLDAKLRVQMRTEISKLHSRLGTTMVYVTHDQVEAMTMGTRIVVLKDGRVQQMDSPLNLYNTPVNKFVAGFIGSPSMNFIKGEIVQQDGLYFKDSSFQLKLESTKADKISKYINKKITLGIRPEDIVEINDPTIPNYISPAQFKVEVVEPMGNEMFLYLNTGKQTITVRFNPNNQPKLNENYTVGFDMRKTHFFDLDSEEVIN